jgi:cytochrome b561
MALAVVLLFSGFVAILMHKSEKGHSFVPESLHGALGLVVVAVTAAQGAVGVAKHSRFQRNQGKSYRWHGNTGQAVYVVHHYRAVQSTFSR